MKTNTQNLYRIVGEEGASLERLKEAVAWLLSPKAEGIGQKLLEDAYALHGKPVTINVSQIADDAYDHVTHAIDINPDNLQKMSFGASQHVSVEGTLAHELTHSGQTRIKEGLAKVEKLKGEILDSHLQQFPDALKPQDELMKKVTEATDAKSASAYSQQYLEEVARFNEELERKLHAHPKYIEFIREFEDPAVAVQNNVARLRGEPLRTNYLNAPDIDAADLHHMTMKQLSGMFNPNEWVQKAKGVKKNHPLVARYPADGRQP